VRGGTIIIARVLAHFLPVLGGKRCFFTKLFLGLISTTNLGRMSLHCLAKHLLEYGGFAHLG
jgi:hypothetical protein